MATKRTFHHLRITNCCQKIASSPQPLPLESCPLKASVRVASSSTSVSQTEKLGKNQQEAATTKRTTAREKVLLELLSRFLAAARPRWLLVSGCLCKFCATFCGNFNLNSSGSRRERETERRGNFKTSLSLRACEMFGHCRM